jgi:hypothetical protein
MSRYVVTFFKNLVDSDGHPFKAPQERIELASSSPQQAVEVAIERFIGSRHVGDWTIHADSLELSGKA